VAEMNELIELSTAFGTQQNVKFRAFETESWNAPNVGHGVLWKKLELQHKTHGGGG
jgi:hypothetical protein